MKLISTKQDCTILIHLGHSADGEVLTGQFEARNVFRSWDSATGIGVAEMQIDITDGDTSKDEIAEVFIGLVKHNTGIDIVLDVDFVNMVNEAGGKGHLINASSIYDTCIAFLLVSMTCDVFEVQLK